MIWKRKLGSLPMLDQRGVRLLRVDRDEFLPQPLVTGLLALPVVLAQQDQEGVDATPPDLAALAQQLPDRKRKTHSTSKSLAMTLALLAYTPETCRYFGTSFCMPDCHGFCGNPVSDGWSGRNVLESASQFQRFAGLSIHDSMAWRRE
jgi:hypothetical protein